MEATIQDKPPRRRTNGVEPMGRVVPWWDHVWCPHPMNDQDFVTAFCEFMLAKSPDHSLALVRKRAYYFVRQFMAPEIAASLAAYREVHPL